MTGSARLFHFIESGRLTLRSLTFRRGFFYFVVFFLDFFASRSRFPLSRRLFLSCAWPAFVNARRKGNVLVREEECVCIRLCCVKSVWTGCKRPIVPIYALYVCPEKSPALKILHCNSVRAGEESEKKRGGGTETEERSRGKVLKLVFVKASCSPSSLR